MLKFLPILIIILVCISRNGFEFKEFEGGNRVSNRTFTIVLMFLTKRIYL